MKSKRTLAGIAAFAALGALAFVAALLTWWWLVMAALAAMLGAIGILAINTNIMLRKHRASYDATGVGLGAGAGSGAEASADDVTGTVRLLAAQYVGRLDRAQSSLESAISNLEELTPRVGHGS